MWPPCSGFEARNNARLPHHSVFPHISFVPDLVLSRPPRRPTIPQLAADLGRAVIRLHDPSGEEGHAPELGLFGSSPSSKDKQPPLQNPGLLETGPYWALWSLSPCFPASLAHFLCFPRKTATERASPSRFQHRFGPLPYLDAN